jgi:hypothetical protein
MNELLLEIGAGALIASILLLGWKITRAAAAITAEMAKPSDSLTGAAVSDRFEAIEHRSAQLAAQVSQVGIDCNTAIKGVQGLRSQNQRDVDKLTTDISQAILPQVQQLLQSHYAPPTVVPSNDFLPR